MRVAIVGARGHVGAELVALIEAHPSLELVAAGSRAWAGEPVRARLPAHRGGLRWEDLTPQRVAQLDADVCVLALPNGLAAAYDAAITADAPRAPRRAGGMRVLDLSADMRFDDAWTYGLPELTRASIQGAARVSNPGCYATAMQLAAAPLLRAGVVQGGIVAHGISGYSGAGTTPSERNDPTRLADNLLTYAMVDHIHEREATRQLGHPVWFTPTVASFFRGILMTLCVPLRSDARVQLGLRADAPADAVQAALWREYQRVYAQEPGVQLTPQPPEPAQVAGRHHAAVGGLTVATDASHVVVLCALDNLLKGAASQAVQNLNLMHGLPEWAGLRPAPAAEQDPRGDA